MSVFGLPFESLALFALAVLLLALTPGPVWVYLLSRTLTQGRRAGYFSLLGVAAGVLVHLAAAALGITVVLLAVPFAFDAIKLAGAAYLLWLAVDTLRGGGIRFTPQPLDPVPDRVLFRQALIAAVVNPKVAVFYLSLFPQFVEPAAGPVLRRACCSAIVHLWCPRWSTGPARDRRRRARGVVRDRPGWLRLQRWLLGTAFGALAIWLAMTPRHPST
jgi:threonine/homoserine/homoserine lactone efflux protein